LFTVIEFKLELNFEKIDIDILFGALSFKGPDSHKGCFQHFTPKGEIDLTQGPLGLINNKEM